MSMNSEGTTLYVWHSHRRRYEEVHWLPGVQLTKSAGKVMALYFLLGNPAATRVQVTLPNGDFEESIRSERGIVRLKTTSEKGRSAA